MVAGLGVFLALATSAFAQPVLVRADFLSLPGSSHATAINSSGQVTGRAHRPDTNESAFVWTLADGIVFIGLGGNDGFGTAINENGAVVGGSQTPSGDDHAFYWTEVTGAIDLGTLGGSSSFALDINDNEAVVGTSETATGEQHAFYWKQGDPFCDPMCDLGTLGGANSDAKAINNLGEVVGRAQVAVGRVPLAARRSDSDVGGSGSWNDLSAGISRRLEPGVRH